MKKSRIKMKIRIRKRTKKRGGTLHLPKEYWFDHEKLEVYRDAIDFIAWLSPLLDGVGPNR